MRTVSSLFVIFSLVFSTYAFASDFAKLAVVLAVLFIAFINFVIGVRACMISKAKGFLKTLPHFIVIVILALICIVMIMDEVNHMTNSDTVGLLATAFAAGILFLVIAFWVQKRPKQ